MDLRYAKCSEDTEQIHVIQWAQWNEDRYPELKWLHHCPNGGSRNRIEAVKLKQMGVKAGVSDLCLPYPKGVYCGLYIEMKYGSNRLQESQKKFLSDMAAAGHYVITCYSAEDAIDILEEYCGLRPAGTPESTYRDLVEQMEDGALSNGIRSGMMRFPVNSILKDGKEKGGGKR